MAGLLVLGLLRVEPVGAFDDNASDLFDAVERGDVEAVGRVLQHDRAPDRPNRYGLSPLHAACASGSSALVGLLLDAGADPRVSTPGGETPLMTCAASGASDALEMLLARGANLEARESWHHQTALMWAVAAHQPDAVRILLLHGADLDARSEAGLSPLMYAVRESDIKATELLLASGADVNEPGPNQTTPLLVALINAHFDLASRLLDWGADAATRDSPHGSALHVLAWVRRQAPAVGMGASPIQPRLLDDETDSLTVAKKLIDYGANVNARFDIKDPWYREGLRGTTFYYAPNPPDLALGASVMTWDRATPFWIAAKNADVPLMRLLASRGANPRLTNRVHVTPLMVAAGAGYLGLDHPGTEQEGLEATKLALELGNNVNEVADFGPIERMTDLRFSGLTALHGAAQRGANSIVSLLVERGARLDARTRAGWTPFNIADGIQVGGTFKNSPGTAALLRSLMVKKGLKVERVRPETILTER